MARIPRAAVGSLRPRGWNAAWLLVALFVPATAFACLWDYDTLPQERSRFPTTLELITGKFLRHSPEFYAWRIEDRRRRLAADPRQLPLYDDLAVAYQKTGMHDLAVETILEKEQLQPGLYETYSNLGTFYILAGDLERGLPYIDKALAIDPDAHFGREKYQKALVEYAMDRRVDGKLFFPLGAEVAGDGTLARDDLPAPPPATTSASGVAPKRLEPPPPKRKATNFAAHLAEAAGVRALSDDEQQKAVKGILGMMRFADHRNPLLLEALGDLLLSRPHPFGPPRQEDAKQLAARAYLVAASSTSDPAAKKWYEHAADQALAMQVDPRPDVRAQLEAEQADADRWYAELAAREAQWIKEGKDPEAAFDALYTAEPASLDASGVGPQFIPPSLRGGSWLSAALAASAALALGLMVVRSARRSSKRTNEITAES